MPLRWTTRPELRRPALVAAFEGWNDAADAASNAVRWLARRLEATECAAFDPEDYVDFQSSRPQVELVDGVVQKLTWPGARLLAARRPDAERDLLLLLAVEPNLRWPTFCNEVLDALTVMGGDTAVTLGALLADVPHTRPVRLTGSATDEATATRIRLGRSHYQGPTGIVGVLHNAARESGLSAASLWAPVPHYVATSPNAKATRALLLALATLLDMQFDVTDLDIAAAAWERLVADVVAADDDISRYVRDLEQRWDEADDHDDSTSHPVDSGYHAYDEAVDQLIGGEDSLLASGDLPSGETLAADFEQYLREQEDDQ